MIRRKNPIDNSKILDILEPYNLKYLAEGDHAEIFKFTLKNLLRIENILLKPGTYILKLQKEFKFSPKERTYFNKLSKLKLIPHIYIIEKDFIIMDYVKGKTLLELVETLPPGRLSSLFLKIGKTLNKWHDLNYSHGDMHIKNIMIDSNGEVILIDPKYISYKQTQEDFDIDNQMFSILYETYLD